MGETSVVPLNQQPGACPWCSSPISATFHTGQCNRVGAIEYHPNGSIKRVEFAKLDAAFRPAAEEKP